MAVDRWVADARAWLREAGPAIGAVAGALALTGWVASSPSRLWVVPALAALVATTAWYATVSQAARQEVRFHPRVGRLVVSGVLLVVTGVAPFVLSGARTAWPGHVQTAADTAGVGLLLLGLGGVVAELRLFSWGRGPRGLVALAVGAVALVGALLAPSTSPLLAMSAAVAAVAVAVGFEMLSEDRLPPNEWGDGSAPRVAALGVVALVLSAVLLMALGTAPATSLLVVAALVGVVWLLSARSDNLLLTLGVAVALLWAAAPRSDPVALVAKARDLGDPYFVVFGDSYISGEGASVYQEGTNTKEPDDHHTNECRRANTAWPILLAEARVADLPHRTLFLACSGAVASQLWESPGLEQTTGWRSAQEVALYRLQQPGFARGERPEFALVSIGGNDALFSVIGTTCIAPGSCREAFGQAFLDSLDGLGAKLDRAYRDVAQAVGPGVPIIAVPYPDPIAEGATSCPGIALDAGERSFLRGYVERLDATVEAAARRNGVHYMDTMFGALADGGSRLCESTGTPGLNFLALHPQGGSVSDLLLPTNWTHNSLHPNEEGHRLMRAAAERWFEANPVAGLSAPTPVTLDEAALEASEAPKPSIVPSGWVAEQGQHLARRLAVPLVLALAGAWMVLIALLRRVAGSGWSVAGKLRQAARWAVAPPD